MDVSENYPKTKGFAGDPRSLEMKGLQEQHQGQEGSIWTDTLIFQLWVLKSQQGVKPAVQAVSHGNDMMYVCICTFQHVVSHEPNTN